MRDMSVNMHLRDVPESVHEELHRRASACGMTLRQYTIKVLNEHCAVPTLDEWMTRMARRRASWLSSDRNAAIDPVAAIDGGRDDLYGEAG